MINFDVTKDEHKLITEIAKRAVAKSRELGKRYDLLTAQMDICACHCNGNPLRLEELLKADDFNFFHDVFGIARHVDRKTGELKDCFVPRFSAPDKPDKPE